MNRSQPNRTPLSEPSAWLAAVCLFASAGLVVSAAAQMQAPDANGQSLQQAQQQGQATGERRSPAPIERRPGQPRPVDVLQGQHLAQWMNEHKSLPLDQQQQALANERGFRDLAPVEQQRMYQRLAQLNSMNPAQRQRLLSRTEAMERLPPMQRQQVREAMRQLGSLPADRRHIVARTFYTLRDMQPYQRQGYLNSADYASQFNAQERSAIGNLLTVTPFFPPLQAPAPQSR